MPNSRIPEKKNIHSENVKYLTTTQLREHEGFISLGVEIFFPPTLLTFTCKGEYRIHLGYRPLMTLRWSLFCKFLSTCTLHLIGKFLQHEEKVIVNARHLLIYFCIPESLNTNISHQLFDFTMTFVNSQH